MFDNLFRHASADGCLDFFQLRVSRCGAAVNICVHRFVRVNTCVCFYSLWFVLAVLEIWFALSKINA